MFYKNLQEMQAEPRARQAAFVLVEMLCLFHAAQRLAIIALPVLCKSTQRLLFYFAAPPLSSSESARLSFSISMTYSLLENLCMFRGKIRVLCLSNSGLQELSLRLVILAQLDNTVLAGRQHRVRARAPQAAIAVSLVRYQTVCRAPLATTVSVEQQTSRFALQLSEAIVAALYQLYLKELCVPAGTIALADPRTRRHVLPRQVATALQEPVCHRVSSATLDFGVPEASMTRHRVQLHQEVRA
jgi:hypothetical protein